MQRLTNLAKLKYSIHTLLFLFFLLPFFSYNEDNPGKGPLKGKSIPVKNKQTWK